MARIPKLASVIKRRLTPQQKLHMLHHKYGSITDFSRVASSTYAVAKRMGLSWNTVDHALKRHARVGGSVEAFLLKRQPTRQFRKLSAELQTLLASKELLQAWAPFSLRERCRIIERVFNVRVTHQMLQLFYKAHNTAYLSAKSMKQLEFDGDTSLDAERLGYAKLLASVIAHNLPVVYMDETTANSEFSVKKAWTRRGTTVTVPTSNRRYHCTVYACISPTCLYAPVYVIREATTNNVHFREFLREVMLRMKHQAAKPFAVFDGHSAHLTRPSAAVLEEYFTPLRFPPRSCEFNAVETVFAHLKQNLRKLLAQIIPTDQQDFERLVARAANLIPPSSMVGILKANHEFIRSRLTAQVQ